MSYTNTAQSVVMPYPNQVGNMHFEYSVPSAVSQLCSLPEVREHPSEEIPRRDIGRSQAMISSPPQKQRRESSHGFSARLKAAVKKFGRYLNKLRRGRN